MSQGPGRLLASSLCTQLDDLKDKGYIKVGFGCLIELLDYFQVYQILKFKCSFGRLKRHYT